MTCFAAHTDDQVIRLHLAGDPAATAEGIRRALLPDPIQAKISRVHLEAAKRRGWFYGA